MSKSIPEGMGWRKGPPAGIVILAVAAAAELVLAFTSCRQRQQGRNVAPARGAVFVLKRGF